MNATGRGKQLSPLPTSPIRPSKARDNNCRIHSCRGSVYGIFSPLIPRETICSHSESCEWLEEDEERNRLRGRNEKKTHEATKGTNEHWPTHAAHTKLTPPHLVFNTENLAPCLGSSWTTNVITHSLDKLYYRFRPKCMLATSGYMKSNYNAAECFYINRTTDSFWRAGMA